MPRWELPAHRDLGLPRGTSRAIEDDDGHRHGLAIQYNLNAGAYSASNWEVHGGAEASNRLRVCVSVLFCMFRPLRFVRLVLFVFGMQALDEGRCHHCFARVV